MVADASATNPLWRRLLAATAVLYAAALAIVLFWPVHVDGRGGLFRFDPVLNLLGRFGIPAWASYPFVEFAHAGMPNRPSTSRTGSKRNRPPRPSTCTGQNSTTASAAA